MARPHPARWAVQNRRNVHKQLDTAIEGTAVDHVESNVGVPVVDPVRTGACCDNRKDDHAEAVDETGFQEGAAQGKAAHRGHVVGALVFHVPHDLDSVLADESRVWPRQGASNPQVRMPIRLSPQVAKSAPGTLSRWRHGFKSRWDYGAAEGWPGWWGLQGPEYLEWLGEQPETDYAVLMSANTYRFMSGLAAEGEPGTEALAGLSKVVFSTTLKDSSRFRHFLTSPGRSRDECGTRPTRRVGTSIRSWFDSRSRRRREHCKNPNAAGQRVYRSSGFMDIEIPDEYKSHWIFMEKSLV